MPFRDPILAGTTLVRAAIHSPNYVAGAAGWTVNADGSAEFNNLVTRGEFSTGTTGNRVRIYSFGGFAFILLYSADPNELEPGQISNSSQASGTTSVSTTQFEGSNDGSGALALVIRAPDPAGADPGGSYTFQNTQGSGSGAGQMTPVTLNSRVKLRLNNGSNVGLASTDHGFQIGADNGPNLRADPNEMQAANNGAAAGLYLQDSGGDLTAFLTSYLGGNIANRLNVYGTIYAPPMREQASPIGGAVSTLSAAYVALGATAVTGQYPPSGTLAVEWGAAASNNNAAGYAFMSMEIRDTNSAGTVRYAANNSAAASQQGGFGQSTVSTRTVVTGLPTSGTYFVRPMYLAAGAGTAAFDRNFLTVTPQP